MNIDNRASKAARSPHLLRLAAALRRLRYGVPFLAAGVLIAAITPPENLQEALEAQRAAVAQNPTDSARLNDLGNLQALAGHLEEAEESYRRALGVAPDNSVSLYNLALVLQEQGRTKEAREMLQSILESDPRHAWAHYQLGTLFAAKNNRAKALRHYEIAFTLDRSLVDPKVNPHIVENRLVTDALLQVYVSQSPSTQAPRLYEQPGDVANLLLPATLRAVEGADAAADAERPSRRYRTSFQPSPGSGSVSEAPADGDIDASTRTLDESDLRSSPTDGERGQATSWSGTATTLQPGTPTGPTPTRSVTPSSPGPGSTVSPPAAEAAPFIPRTESTGRLEIELLPDTDPPAMVSAR